MMRVGLRTKARFWTYFIIIMTTWIMVTMKLNKMSVGSKYWIKRIVARKERSVNLKIGSPPT